MGVRTSMDTPFYSNFRKSLQSISREEIHPLEKRNWNTHGNALTRSWTSVLRFWWTHNQFIGFKFLDCRISNAVLYCWPRCGNYFNNPSCNIQSLFPDKDEKILENAP